MSVESGVQTDTSHLSAGLNVILGIWLLASPWIYGAAGNPNSWNSWIVGGLIILFGCIRFTAPAGATFLRYANMVLAAWIFVSPWIYGYTANGGRFINSLCVGVVIFVICMFGASDHPREVTGTPIRHS